MRICRVRTGDDHQRVGLLCEGGLQLLDLSQLEDVHCLADILHSPDPAGLARFLLKPDTPLLPLDQVRLLAPIDRQEVWAAGVTYKRSQVARMEESESAASHYDKVYTADRPEIFFKATPGRVSGPDEPVRVRYDSEWSVPEPEFTLALSPAGKIVGYTIGNDMSARDIEGENPLYLPQAKMYRQCAGLGPSILLTDEAWVQNETQIELRIFRGEEIVFSGTTDLGQMARRLTELADWLFRENDLPNGAFLMTGTGIVPDDNFTLEDGDTCEISVTGIGTLRNPVVKAAGPQALSRNG